MTFIIKLMTSQTYLFTRDWNRIILTFSCKQLCQGTLNLHLKFGAILLQTYKDMTLYPHIYQTCMSICFRKTPVYRNGLYISACNSRNIVSFSLCLVSFQGRQIVLSRKVCHFVVAYMWRKLWSYLHSYLNSPRIVVSYKWKYVHKVLINACSSLSRKKCDYVNWPSPHNHSCCMGRKATNKKMTKKRATVWIFSTSLSALPRITGPGITILP